jgi:hypothetical protein
MNGKQIERDDDTALTNCLNSIQAHRKEAQANYKAAIVWRERGYNVVPQKAIDLKHPGVKW